MENGEESDGPADEATNQAECEMNGDGGGAENDCAEANDCGIYATDCAGISDFHDTDLVSANKAETAWPLQCGFRVRPGWCCSGFCELLRRLRLFRR